jgi:peptidoglycan pentaglycine glycine transferase (the first glycine)
MEWIAVREPDTWNAALVRLPRPHVLQSWEWGAFKARHGWSASYWLLHDGGCPRAAMLVLLRRWGRFPPSLLYVPKGPLLDHHDTAAWDAVLTHVGQLVRRRSVIFCKIDPDVDADNADVVTRLLRNGWRPSPEQIQFRNTMVVDLSQGEEALLAGMKSKWRYNIRLAQRKGVTTDIASQGDLPLLFEMYRETALRDGFVIRPFDYYQDAWGSFIDRGLAQPLIARVGDEPVAMVILFRFGDTAWYMYGASRDRHREKMPNHLLQWEAMRWAQSRGCKTYDLWGAPDAPLESDPMWGVYRFKQGFGAGLVRHIGAYDLAASRFWYWVYTAAAPQVLALMRRRYWARS